MLPAAVAGIYKEQQASVDLIKLSENFGWEFVQGEVAEIRGEEDSGKKRVVKWVNGEGHVGEMEYDVCSVDVGSATKWIEGSGDLGESVVYTRPIGKLVDRVRRFEAMDEDGSQRRRVVVIGGGAAGVELTFALKARWSERTNTDIVLIEGSALLGGEGCLPKVVERELRKRGVDTREGAHAKCVRKEGTENVVELENGVVLPFDMLMVAAGARPHEWLKEGTDLTIDDAGYLLVKPTLQTMENERVFGAGDCVSFGELFGDSFPPKAGVYAVRQGAILSHNILVTLMRLTGMRQIDSPLQLKEYVPQKSFLSLLMTGDGKAIGSKYGLVFQGRWVWRLKDYIDLKWMKQFQDDTSFDISEKPNCCSKSGKKKHGCKNDPLNSDFRGSAAEGAGILLAADVLSECFEQQIAVLSRMDGDAQFRAAVQRSAFRPEHQHGQTKDVC